MESAPGSRRQREGPRSRRRRAATSDGNHAPGSAPEPNWTWTLSSSDYFMSERNPSSAASLLQRFEPGEIYAKPPATSTAARQADESRVIALQGLGRWAKILLHVWDVGISDRASNQQVCRGAGGGPPRRLDKGGSRTSELPSQMAG